MKPEVYAFKHLTVFFLLLIYFVTESWSNTSLPDISRCRSLHTYSEQKGLARKKCVTDKWKSSGGEVWKRPSFCPSTESMCLKRSQSIKRIFVTLNFCLTFICLSYIFCKVRITKHLLGLFWGLIGSLLVITGNSNWKVVNYLLLLAPLLILLLLLLLLLLTFDLYMF